MTRLMKCGQAGGCALLPTLPAAPALLNLPVAPLPLPQVTYKRLKETLGCLVSSAAGSTSLPGGPLVDVLFGKREPR